MKHPTKPGQKCRIIKSASSRGSSVGLEVQTRWVHNEILRLDKFEGGVHSVEDIGLVWRVQGEGLASVPKNGSVPANQADVPAVWLEVIEEIQTPDALTTNTEKEITT